MNRIRYQELTDFLNEKTAKKWNKEKLRQLDKESKNFSLEYGILYRKKTNGDKLRVLKENEIDTVIFTMHNHPTGGHFGKDTTYDKISTRFWWKGMYKDITEYIRRCDSCQRRGNKGGKGYLNPNKVGKPFERIGIDFVGPLDRTEKGNRYILVVTDYLTKWPEAKAMKEATAENVVQFIDKRIICRHGCPKIILSDRGTHFRNKLVDGLCERFEIKHKLSSPYHPQTNGLVERFNRTLCKSLVKVSKRKDKWDKNIESVLFAYRTIKHNTTKKTPFFMVYRREAILPIEESKPEKDFGENAIIKRLYDLVKLTEKRSQALGKIRNLRNNKKEDMMEELKKKPNLK